MLHLQHNPDLDKFPMNNLTIRAQIIKCEVAYYKICHTNPVLVDVAIEFYHSLPSQVLLRKMTRLESVAMSFEANDINNAGSTISTTTCTTVNQPTPKSCNEQTLDWKHRTIIPLLLLSLLLLQPQQVRP